MIRKILKFLTYGLILLIFCVLLVVFVPRTYNVPQIESRTNTQYWNLSTGSKIAYVQISGKEPKKPCPIIYLHGGPGGPIYDGNIESLSPLAKDGFDIYLYDQLGGGHSQRLAHIKEYTVDRHKRDLENIVEKVGTEKVILVGQSWGAMLAVAFIADHPEKVEKAIFTGPGPILPIRRELRNVKPPDSLKLKLPYYSNRQGNENTHNIRSIAMLKWARQFGQKLATDDEADDFATSLNGELNKSMYADTTNKPTLEGGAGFYVQVMTVKSFDEVKDQRLDLQKAKFPVLIMKGQYDNQSWGYTQEYTELFSNYKLIVIPDAGHAISAEKPKLYLETIRNFLLD